MNSSIGRTASPPIDDQLDDNVDVNGDYDNSNDVDYGCGYGMVIGNDGVLEQCASA